MLYAFQDDRIGSPVDPADRAPITLPNPYPVLMATQRPSRGIRRKRRGGKGLDLGEQRPPVAPRQCSELLGGDRRDDQPHRLIIDTRDKSVNDIWSPTATKSLVAGKTRQQLFARAGEVTE
jgi:hypothetical protein